MSENIRWISQDYITVTDSEGNDISHDQDKTWIGSLKNGWERMDIPKEWQRDYKGEFYYEPPQET